MLLWYLYQPKAGGLSLHLWRYSPARSARCEWHLQCGFGPFLLGIPGPDIDPQFVCGKANYGIPVLEGLARSLYPWQPKTLSS